MHSSPACLSHAATLAFALQEVRQLVQHHFSDERPFELPLVTKLYVLRKQASASHSLHSGCSERSAEEEEEEASHALQHHTRTRLTW